MITGSSYGISVSRNSARLRRIPISGLGVVLTATLVVSATEDGFVVVVVVAGVAVVVAVWHEINLIWVVVTYLLLN